jgi:hypothetical protein
MQETGPHLFEFSPAGTAFEYYAHSIGARSQSAKTYLEKYFESFEDGESSEKGLWTVHPDRNVLHPTHTQRTNPVAQCLRCTRGHLPHETITRHATPTNTDTIADD